MVIGISTNPDKKNYKKIGALLLIIGIIFAVVASIFLMTQFPDAYKKDRYGEDGELPDHDSPAKSFFGSYSEGEDETSWGAGLDWYLSFIAAGLLAVSLIILLTSREEPGPYSRSTEQRSQQRPQREEPGRPREQQQPRQQKQPRGKQEPNRPRSEDDDRRPY